MSCDHSALQSGGARYVAASGQLQLVIVCDSCGAECRALERVDYRPRPRRLVGHLAELTARELGLDEQQTARLRFAALVCGQCRDRIPAEIVNKRGPLSAAEWVEVRRHPELGAALIGDVSLEDIREWILCYRERPDGSGYPRGLTGAEIHSRRASSPSPTPTRQSSAIARIAPRAATTRLARSCCGAPAASSTQPSSTRFSPPCRSAIACSRAPPPERPSERPAAASHQAPGKRYLRVFGQRSSRPSSTSVSA